MNVFCKPCGMRGSVKGQPPRCDRPDCPHPRAPDSVASPSAQPPAGSQLCCKYTAVSSGDDCFNCTLPKNHAGECDGGAIPERAAQPQPEEARELNLKWGRHDGRGEYHIEWHAPCGCAYHPEPKPHMHPCIKHSPIDDPLYILREMWLDFPGISMESLSSLCIGEMSPEQADFYAAACNAAKAK